ncbi:MAG: fibrobacter succinogenes major paralogous domain-containing protein [Candidatus Omnitrophica bacterium]|jgi:uncharacterized protein (TIGR02145 family)|nr:fibrobacter succinogenes major paralogous domain-containing protein [Candidatus Omnitrophota bacterium]
MGFFFGQNKSSESTPVIKYINYGRMYNWYAASNPLFAPENWRVPTLEDFQTLVATIGSTETLTDGKLKEIGNTHWNEPNTDATDEYGFKGLPGGYRQHTDGVFTQMGISCYLGSITDYFGVDWYYLFLMTNDGTYITNYINRYRAKSGYSIRLVSDINPGASQITDLDGNIYDVINIGTQYWLKQNWACTKLNEGTAIPNVTDNTAWTTLTTLAYCNYNNDESYVFL